MGFFDFVKRKWDGSPSRYSSTEAYCRACLINLNQAAGRKNDDEWTQDLCKLPVREPGKTDYSREALTAAAAALAGARTPMRKPSEVSEKDWQEALKAAARELISAYKQFDELAPDSVYEIAGIAPPKDRTASSSNVTITHPSCLVNTGGSYSLQLQEQATEHSAMRSFIVRRQSNGQYRWFSRSCTAVLNRVGEIDSTLLFDNFVRRVADYGYPYRTFFHQGKRFKTGQCDFVARDGYVLITSGVYDDTPLAAIEIAAVCNNPTGWGESIGYKPISREKHTIEGIDVPVYTDGYLVEISTLPESQAAALFTQINVEEVNEMDQKVREALVALARNAGLSDEELEAWLAQVEATNRQIAEAAITARAVVEGETTPEQEKADDGEDGIVKMAREVVAQREALNQLAEQMRNFITDITARVEALEAAQNRQRQIYLNDLPAPRVEVWRPKNARDDGEGEQSSAAERAKRILQEKIRKEVRK